ncbi:methyltransferase-like protein 27 [Ylistrum balloti]|uniref:methyltransferase-like protein 27 n=1 Tax=Ylistrum balloti TaxID=509963 RepID=UPI00290583DA|nr:methyltransferase-like protein 27 [Ylistrum balloti]
MAFTNVPQLSKLDERRTLAMLMGGSSQQQVATHFGVHKSTISTSFVQRYFEFSSMDCPFPWIVSKQSPNQLTDVYDGWSESYDKDVNGIHYVAPLILAKTLAAFYPVGGRTVKVLDIATGTGIVGFELQKLGFSILDGLDPSQRMLDAARGSNVYRNLICKYFTAEPTPGLEKDSYDVIVSAGSLFPGHLPPDCFIEAARIVKPGGLICVITRTEGKGSFFSDPKYLDKFKATIKLLKEEEKLEEIKWEKTNYYKSTSGVLILYRVLQ